MKIYIAGPYTKGDVAQNVRLACEYANILSFWGHTPFIPHLTHFWHMIYPHEYEFWLAQDMEWLKVCDAVVRIPGESSGADKEVEKAKELNIPVYYDLAELVSFKAAV